MQQHPCSIGADPRGAILPEGLSTIERTRPATRVFPTTEVAHYRVEPGIRMDVFRSRSIYTVWP